MNDSTQTTMPTKKVVALLIVCVAIIASLGIFEHNRAQARSIAALQTKNTVSVDTTPRPVINSDADWQTLLKNSSLSGNLGAITFQSKNLQSPVPSGEGTLTDQMSKDFFGQFLQLSQGGQTVTADQANQIAINTLSSSQYSHVSAIQYKKSDLHYISQDTSKDAGNIYYISIQQILIKNFASIKSSQDVITLVNTAVSTNKESVLNALDPVIRAEKKVIVDFLNISVPVDAINVHLQLLNATSNILANTEALRVVFSDPVRSFSAVSEYKKANANLQSAGLSLNAYYKSKQ